MVNATSPTANFNRVEVRGAFVGWDGTPVTGTITFLPRAARAVDVAALKTIIRRPITASLSSTTGAFSVLLPATNDPDINVSFTYQVTENFAGGETYDIVVPVAAEATGIDIASVTRTYPVEAPAGAFPATEVAAASTTVQGTVKLATTTQTVTGTATDLVTTPAGVKAAVDALRTALTGPGVPAALDTLAEITTQLLADESAAAALTNTVAAKLAKASNLSDLVDKTVARTNLSVYSKTEVDDAVAEVGSAPIDYSRMAPGGTITVDWDGTKFVIGTTTINARPTPRTDLHVVVNGGTAAVRPAWLLARDTHDTDVS